MRVMLCNLLKYIAIVLLSLMAWQEAADAQQSLPAISVGAARAVKRTAAARPKTTPVLTAARPRVPPPAPDAVPAVAQTAPDGALPIVTDQFATVLVVPNAELRRSTGATLGDVLFSRPGVTGTEFAPGAASRPVVRGLDNYRVRIQENGIGASGASELGEDHAVPLDPLGMNQLEVVRGPATLRWGSQAIGGVVNATNNRIPDALPCPPDATALEKAHGCARLETSSAVSTVDAGMEGAALVDAGAQNIALHGDILGRGSSNYAIPGYPYLYPPEPPPPVDGRQPNSSMRAHGFSIGGSVIGDNGYAGLAITQFATLYHIPGVEPAQADARINLLQTKVTSKGEIRPSSSFIDAIRFWGGAIDYKNEEYANESGFDGLQQTFVTKAQEGRVEAQLAPINLPFAKFTGMVGLQATHQYLNAPGIDGGLLDPNDTGSIGGFSFNEFAFDEATRAQIAGRVENVSIAGSSPNLFVDPALVLTRHRNFTPVSGAAGLLRNMPFETVLSLNAQYIQRAPAAPELLSRGMHEATGTFDIGNPNLRIEAAKTVELGIKRGVGPLRFEATAYYTSFDGFIFRNLTGQSCGATFASCTPGGEGGPLREAVYSQRNAIFRGAEFQSQYDAASLYGGVFGVENQFDVVRATFAGGGNVPRIPPVRLGGGVFWRDANWLARVTLLHAFAQYNIDPTNETPTAGYNLLKAEISYKAKLDPRGRREMTIGVSGNNLLNQNMRNAVSYRKDEVLLPGANLRFFANILF